MDLCFYVPKHVKENNEVTIENMRLNGTKEENIDGKFKENIGVKIKKNELVILYLRPCILLRTSFSVS